MLKDVKIDESAKTITITLDLEIPTRSASGKTMVIGSTRGNAVAQETFKGKPISVGVNVYFKE
jgi:hypothetical protein